jgi:2-oxo-4-hydroxy-4-carboxy-5-ureidoimidazoline decarboxylase
LRTSNRERTGFLAQFGDVFEHSPWIAGRVWDSGLDSRHDTAEGLHLAFANVIQSADHAQKLRLLRAHPQLAVGIAQAEELTAASQAEQRGAGLDRCTTDEYAEFQRLNEDYLKRFNFPFIMAVKGYDRHSILQAFRIRLLQDEKNEFETAVEQVIRIGRLRIEKLCQVASDT